MFAWPRWHSCFFSAVVGRAPLVGEKVLVKAVQDPSPSVKWTAQRVQVLNGQVNRQGIFIPFASYVQTFIWSSCSCIKPFKSPPPLLHSTTPNLAPGILGNKRQPLLKSPKIPPLIPGMQPNPGNLRRHAMWYCSSVCVLYVNMFAIWCCFQVACCRYPTIRSCHGLLPGVEEAGRDTTRS